MGTAPARDSTRRVELTREGLLLPGESDKRFLPLWGGAVDYAFIPADALEHTLDAICELGATVVSSSIPWSLHQSSPGPARFEGRHDRYSLALPRFAAACHKRDLALIARIGPTTAGELPGAGIPAHVLHNPDCMARGPQGEQVLGLFPPPAFAIPSYAATSYRDAVDDWLSELAPVLLSLCYPQGPLVAISLENHISGFYRSAAFDQDYHPDAVASYRRYLTDRSAAEDPREDYDEADPAHVLPPRGPTDGGPGGQLDWLAFREETLLDFLARQRQTLEQHGLADLPWINHSPLMEHGQLSSLTALQTRVDAAAPDLRQLRPQKVRLRHAFAAMRGQSRLWVPQLPLGATALWTPTSIEEECHVALTALMAGATGLLFDSLGHRDRWAGAVIGADGRPQGHRFQRIKELFAAAKVHQLHRNQLPDEVALVRRRQDRHRATLCSLLEPLPPLAVELLGLGAVELTKPDGSDQTARLRRLLTLLEATGRGFGLLGDDASEETLSHYQLIAAALPSMLEVAAISFSELETQLLDELGDALARPRWRRLVEGSDHSRAVVLVHNPADNTHRWNARKALDLPPNAGLWDALRGFPVDPEQLPLRPEEFRLLCHDQGMER